VQIKNTIQTKEEKREDLHDHREKDEIENISMAN
jgi:hypothetical protein